MGPRIHALGKFAAGTQSTLGSPLSISLITAGVATLVIALVYEAFFTEFGVIPAPFFKDRTIGAYPFLEALGRGQS